MLRVKRGRVDVQKAYPEMFLGFLTCPSVGDVLRRIMIDLSAVSLSNVRVEAGYVWFTAEYA